MLELKRKAEDLASRCRRRLELWGRPAWDAARRRAVGGGRLVLAWFRGHPTASVALAVLGVIAVLLGPVLWAVGGWALVQETTTRALTAFRNLSDADDNPEKTVEAYGKLIGAVGLLAAAPFGLLGVGLAFWRTWNQHRDGVLAARKLEAESYAKAAEAFAKAVDHLGSDKSSVRMGAVLALEALGKATPRLLSQAIEILCAFVRENRPVSIAPPASKHSKIVRFPTDIELIITIVSRLRQQDTDSRITVDLSYADLSDANLINANLSKADLSKADLSEAALIGINLIEAGLMQANLSKAGLMQANLSKASLIQANLSGADLKWANLSKANLMEANLNGADLIGADLSGADLSGADLRAADLRAADLRGATLPDGRVWTNRAPPSDEVIAEAVAKAHLS